MFYKFLKTNKCKKSNMFSYLSYILEHKIIFKYMNKTFRWFMFLKIISHYKNLKNRENMKNDILWKTTLPNNKEQFYENFIFIF